MASCCIPTLKFVFTLDSNVGIPERPFRQQHDAVIQPRDTPRTATQCCATQQPSMSWGLPERHAARDSCNNQMTGKATHRRVAAASMRKLPNWHRNMKRQQMPKTGQCCNIKTAHQAKRSLSWQHAPHNHWGRSLTQIDNPTCLLPDHPQQPLQDWEPSCPQCGKRWFWGQNRSLHQQ